MKRMNRVLLLGLAAMTIAAGSLRLAIESLGDGRAPSAAAWEEPDAVPQEPYGRPTLFLFTADWCPECRILEETVLGAEEFARFAERRNLRLVRLRESRLGPFEFLRALEDFGLPGIPAFVVSDANGLRASPLVGARTLRNVTDGIAWRLDWLEHRIRWRAWKAPRTGRRARPALLLFNEARFVPGLEAWWREWSPPAAPSLNRAFDLFTADKGNREEAADRYRKWAIRRVPTVILLDEQGREVRRFQGLEEVAKIPEWVEKTKRPPAGR